MSTLGAFLMLWGEVAGAAFPWGRREEKGQEWGPHRCPLYRSLTGPSD